MKLSVCIPVYNGGASVGELVREVQTALCHLELEIVMVNDGSRDNSAEICRGLAEQYANIRFLDLRRNFGEHNAVMCALNYCTGDYAAIIDDDLQNPPGEILKLLEEAAKGYDVVYAKYHKKQDPLFRNIGSKFNDIFATWLIGKPKDLYLSSFKIISRAAIDEIIRYKGPFPYIDGLILRSTASYSSVFVEHCPRREGRSNYTLARLLHLWLSMFVNFSIKPMRFIAGTGFFIMLASLACMIYFSVDKILHPDVESGWTSLAVLILFFGGMQTFFLGLIGEYVGKNYLDQNGTPQFSVKASYGIGGEEKQ